MVTFDNGNYDSYKDYRAAETMSGIDCFKWSNNAVYSGEFGDR